MGDIVEVGGRGGNQITAKNHNCRKNRHKHQKHPKKAQPHLAPQAKKDQRNGTSQTLLNKNKSLYLQKQNFFSLFLIFFEGEKKLYLGSGDWFDFNILTAFIRLGRARPVGAGCPPYYYYDFYFYLLILFFDFYFDLFIDITYFNKKGQHLI